ncbi:MAG: response regulator [Verrucomicrobia bacterium]|nr:response regulator [Verrucomicrobiota bacterium]
MALFSKKRKRSASEIRAEIDALQQELELLDGTKEKSSKPVEQPSQEKTKESESLSEKNGAPTSNFNNLFTTLSHELRTPLHGVLGMAQLLEQEIEDSKLKTLESCAEHMQSVLHTVVNLSKVYSNWGDLPEYREWINLHDLLEEIKKRIAQRAINRNLKIHIDHEDKRLRLRADYDHLIHIIETALLGSLECTDPRFQEDEAVLEIKWTHSGGQIKIEFENPLEVMTENRGQKITEAGQMTAAAEGKRIRMEFLYWSLATSLLEHYEGAMLASKTGDKLGVYTTLGFKMETMAASPSDQKPIGGLSLVTKKSSHGTIHAPAFNLNILIVEDDEVSRKLIALCLDKLEQTYLSAVNGEEAIDLLLESPDIALVLMDIDMPLLDGIGATRAIRMGEAGEKAAEVPIAALTAFNSLSERGRFKKAGMDYFLSKPISLKELRSLILDVFQKKAN